MYVADCADGGGDGAAVLATTVVGWWCPGCTRETNLVTVALGISRRWPSAVFVRLQ